MIKIIIILFSMFSISSALITKNVSLFGVKNYCITNDYYYDFNTAFNYYDIKADRWRIISTTKKLERYIDDGFVYDSVRGDCYRDEIILGMKPSEYYSLMALSGLLFSSIIMFIFSSFLVGL